MSCASSLSGWSEVRRVPRVAEGARLGLRDFDPLVAANVRGDAESWLLRLVCVMIGLDGDAAVAI